MDLTKKASEIVGTLDLKPHPHGGFYGETFRDSSVTLSRSQLTPLYKVDRAVSSAIYFLLPSGGTVHLHRIPCAETWHYYMGESLTVFEVHDNGDTKLMVVGPDIEAGQRPQYTVPPNVWFGAFPTHDLEMFSSDGGKLNKAPVRDPDLHYCLVGVTCAPAYQFEDDELATRDQIKTLASHAEPFINFLIPS